MAATSPPPRRPIRDGWSIGIAVARAALAIGAIGLMAATPRFLTAGTLGTILALASIVGVMAVGQAFVLIGGGFDLSQGAIVALVAAEAAKMVVERGVGGPTAAVAALGLGALLGAVNGVCVAWVGTNPFVTTLSTMLIYRGLAFVRLGGLPVRNVTAFAALSEGPELAGTIVPMRGFVFLALAGVAWFVLRRTVFGRHVYAVGGNVEAARLAGLRTIRLRVACFAISGAAAGLAALMLLSWVRVAKPDTAVGYELDAIAACVVGGVSLQGGLGNVLGAAAGALLLQGLGTWITMRGLADQYRSLMIGGVLLAFAAAEAVGRTRGRGR
jgi:ribose/xylose/arabinose/galactoside ABC-type transport system permease subunit